MNCIIILISPKCIILLVCSGSVCAIFSCFCEFPNCIGCSGKGVICCLEQEFNMCRCAMPSDTFCFLCSTQSCLCKCYFYTLERVRKSLIVLLYEQWSNRPYAANASAIFVVWTVDVLFHSMTKFPACARFCLSALFARSGRWM